MRTVLFVGDLNLHSRSYQRYRAFQDLGYSTKGISTEPDNTVPGITKSPGLWRRVRYKLGYHMDLAGANSQILAQIETNRFDLIWIDKGLMIKPATLEKVKKVSSGTRISLWMEEFIEPRCNRSAYSIACLPLFDFVFTPRSQNNESAWVARKNIIKLVIVDDTYDKNSHFPVDVDENDKHRLGSSVSFIGTFEQDRAEKMLFLAESGIDVRVWGNGWVKWAKKHSNLRIENRPLYNDDFVKAICSTKINLCFLRKHNKDRQTNRTMEIPACGGFMLAERTSEHQRLFEEGIEASYFDVNDKQELLEKVQYYLVHDEERKAIAKNGRQRCLESSHSHHDRLHWIIEEVIFKDSYLVGQPVKL